MPEAEPTLSESRRGFRAGRLILGPSRKLFNPPPEIGIVRTGPVRPLASLLSVPVFPAEDTANRLGVLLSKKPIQSAGRPAVNRGHCSPSALRKRQSLSKTRGPGIQRAFVRVDTFLRPASGVRELVPLFTIASQLSDNLRCLLYIRNRKGAAIDSVNKYVFVHESCEPGDHGHRTVGHRLPRRDRDTLPRSAVKKDLDIREDFAIKHVVIAGSDKPDTVRKSHCSHFFAKFRFSRTIASNDAGKRYASLSQLFENFGQVQNSLLFPFEAPDVA